MTDIELTILRHLYLDPIERNFTLSVLNSSLGYERTILSNNLQNLIDNLYVEKVYPDGIEGNHYKTNDPCYRITGFGAKRLNELDGKGLIKTAVKYGALITILFGVINSIGVFYKIHYDRRTDFRGTRQLQLQEKQLELQYKQQQVKQVDANPCLSDKKNP